MSRTRHGDPLCRRPRRQNCGVSAIDHFDAKRFHSRPSEHFPRELYRRVRCQSFLLRRLAFGILRPFGLPLFDFLGLVRGGVQLDQRIEGIGTLVSLALEWTSRAASFPRNQSAAAVRRRRTFLAQERRSEHRLCVESLPDVGQLLLAEGQALAQSGFGIVEPLLLEQV